MRRVVVTGIGIVSSIGDGAAEVTESLRNARSGVKFAPDHAAHGFRSQVWAPPSMGHTAEGPDAMALGTANGPMRLGEPFSTVVAAA